MAPRAQQEFAHQEGSRWVNAPPTGEELAAWFTANVTLHDGMEHARYVQGVVMIPQTETVKSPRQDNDGNIVIDEVTQLVYIPYAKVETRVAYFWDLCLRNDWIGAIEPADVLRLRDPLIYNENLPRGFFRTHVLGPDGKPVHQLCCSKRVRIHRADRTGAAGRAVMLPPDGTKSVALLDRWGKPTASVVERAETGAVGRALGMAGMLVIPGSGVATAEDMQEHVAAQQAQAAPEAVLPASTAEVPFVGDPKLRAQELIGRLQSDHPAAHEAFVAWARDRKVNLSAIDDVQLRGVVRKLEKLQDEANQNVSPTVAP